MRNPFRSMLPLPVAMLFVLPLSLSAQTAPSTETTEETVIQALDKQWLAYTYLPPDGRVAWRAAVEGRWQLFVAGNPVGPPTREYTKPTFSRDQRHVAFHFAPEDKTLVVVDGIEHSISPSASGPKLEFSDDGRALAYQACEPVDKKREKCQSGVVGEEPDTTLSAWPLLVGGGDSLRVIAYAAARTVVSITRPSPELEAAETGREAITTMVFDGKDTPESIRLNLLASSAAGKKKVPRPQFGGMTLSAGRQRFGYVVWGFLPTANTEKGDTLLIGPSVAAVIDGRLGDLHAMMGPIHFSPDGSRVAYAGAWAQPYGLVSNWEVFGYVVVDGVKGPVFERKPALQPSSLFVPWGLDAEWTGVSDPVFSPDSRRIAYVARRGSDDFVVMLDGAAVAVPAMKRVAGGPVFSPDSKHLAFVGVGKDGAQLYVDGAATGSPVPAKTGSIAKSIRFDPTSRHVAFALAANSDEVPDQRFVLDGIAGSSFSSIPVREILFSPDGEHTAFVAAYRTAWVVRDGVRGKGFPRLIPHSLAIGDDGVASYVAGDDRGLLRVRQGGR